MNREKILIGEDIKLAVKKGAQLLDEVMPGWVEKINTSGPMFNMNSCKRCIIGQAVGDYHNGAAKLSGLPIHSRETEAWSIEHGFLAPVEDSYKDLEIVWAETVEERLKNPKI